MVRGTLRAGADRFRHSAKLRATAYYGGSSLVCQGFRFAGLLLSTRLVAPAAFGAFATALMVSGLCGLLREFGLNSALLSHPDPAAGWGRLHFRLTLALTTVAATALVVVCHALPTLAGLRPFLPLLVWTALAEGAAQTPAVLAQKAFRFRELALIEVAATGVWLAAIGLGAAVAPGVAALLAARALEITVRSASLLVGFRRCLFEGTVTAEMWAYYARFAKLLGPQAWLENVFSNLDVLLLRPFVGDVELGVYDRTLQLLRVPLSLSVNLVDRVAGAAYSRDQGDARLLRRSIGQFSVLIAAGSLAGLAGLQLFLSVLAPAALNADWRHSIGALVWWAVPFCLLRPLVWNFNIFFQATGKPVRLLGSLIIMTAALAAFGVWWVPILGARGMLLASGAAYGCALAMQTVWFTQRREGESKTRNVSALNVVPDRSLEGKTGWTGL